MDSPPASSQLKVPVTSGSVPGVVQVRVLPSSDEDGSPPASSQLKVPVTSGSVPGVVQVRYLHL